MTEEGLAEHLQERVTAGESAVPFGRGETKPGRKQGRLRGPDIGNDPMTAHTTSPWEGELEARQGRLASDTRHLPHVTTSQQPPEAEVTSVILKCPSWFLSALGVQSFLPARAGTGSFKLWPYFHLVPCNPYF